MKRGRFAIAGAAILGLTIHASVAGAGIGSGMAERTMPKAADNGQNAGVSAAVAQSQKQERTNDTAEGPNAAEEAGKIVVARINGAEITMLALTRAMNRVAPKYVRNGEPTTPDVTARIRDEALERLIIEELAVQEAIRRDINPKPEALDRVISEVKKNLGNEQAYKEYLDTNNLTEDALKKLIRRSQQLELITAKEVYSMVKVDEKTLRDEYEKEKGKYILPENYFVDDVLFLQGRGEDLIRKRAEEVLAEIKKKANNTSALILDGTFIVRKVHIRKDKFPEIYKAMADLQPGDLSGVIKDKDSFHIVKVLKKEPSRQATFEEARATIEPNFLVPAQEKRKAEWEKKLKATAKIEILSEGGIKTRGQR